MPVIEDDRLYQANQYRLVLVLESLSEPLERRHSAALGVQL